MVRRVGKGIPALGCEVDRRNPQFPRVSYIPIYPDCWRSEFEPSKAPLAAAQLWTPVDFCISRSYWPLKM